MDETPPPDNPVLDKEIADIYAYLGWELDRERIVPDNLTVSIREIAFQPIVRAYLASAKRLSNLCHFPNKLFTKGCAFALAHTWASNEIYQNPFKISPPPIPIVLEKFPSAVAQSIQMELLKAKILGGEIKITITPSDITSGLEAFVSADDDHKSLFWQLMEMQIVGAWTTFETLAGDIWEAAVNVRPHKLAANVKSTVSISALQLSNFNLAATMGSALRKEKDVKFTSLDDISKRFESTFREQNLCIMNILRSHELAILSAVRNNIVHNAAISDGEYEYKSSEFPEEYKRKKGEPLNLNGELTSKIVTGGLTKCVELLRTVDGWLTGHTE